VLKGTSLSDSFAPSARRGLVDGGLVAGGLDGFGPVHRVEFGFCFGLLLKTKDQIGFVP
jgi:hypothetical protein